MENCENTSLKTDKDFTNLIRPLRRQEYLTLEQSLRTEGCKDPILVWNGFIVDGHVRYTICRKHGIPFRTEEADFSCKEEAIAWICARQLKRKNLTEETRKFLIGMQYEAEKLVNHLQFPKGANQYLIRIRKICRQNRTQNRYENCKGKQCILRHGRKICDLYESAGSNRCQGAGTCAEDTVGQTQTFTYCGIGNGTPARGGTGTPE